MFFRSKPKVEVDPRVLARTRVSERYLAGQGVEIGALHNPLPVGASARVRYVDRKTVPELREHYPELAGQKLVEPDIIDDGETLASIPGASLDFVVANHMLEHCENPLGAMRSHLRTLKPGGVLYYAVPDRRFTFDAKREITSFEHLVSDDRDAGESSRHAHYLEWAELVDGKTGAEVAAHAADLERRRYSIHFHVWDAQAYLSFLLDAGRYLDRAFEVEHYERNLEEAIGVLRRRAG